METLAQITAFIDTNIRNFLPLVRKVNHANTHQKITNQLFPDSVVVEWDGDSAVDPITDIVCNPLLPTLAKCTFKIYFTKHGNRVFYKGVIKNTENSIAIGGSFFSLILCTFPTTLYEPIVGHFSYSNLQLINGAPSTLQNAFIQLNDGTLSLRGSIPASINDFSFEGSYKVAN